MELTFERLIKFDLNKDSEKDLMNDMKMFNDFIDTIYQIQSLFQIHNTSTLHFWTYAYSPRWISNNLFSNRHLPTYYVDRLRFDLWWAIRPNLYYFKEKRLPVIELFIS